MPEAEAIGRERRIAPIRMIRKKLKTITTLGLSLNTSGHITPY